MLQFWGLLATLFLNSGFSNCDSIGIFCHGILHLLSPNSIFCDVQKMMVDIFLTSFVTKKMSQKMHLGDKRCQKLFITKDAVCIFCDF